MTSARGKGQLVSDTIHSTDGHPLAASCIRALPASAEGDMRAALVGRAGAGHIDGPDRAQPGRLRGMGERGQVKCVHTARAMREHWRLRGAIRIEVLEQQSGVVAAVLIRKGGACTAQSRCGPGQP